MVNTQPSDRPSRARASTRRTGRRALTGLIRTRRRHTVLRHPTGRPFTHPPTCCLLLYSLLPPWTLVCCDSSCSRLWLCEDCWLLCLLLSPGLPAERGERRARIKSCRTVRNSSTSGDGNKGKYHTRCRRIITTCWRSWEVSASINRRIHSLLDHL